MCGRLAIHFTAEDLLHYFGIIPDFDLSPRYNIAYGEKIPVLLHNAGKLQGDMMEWGLIPAWAKAPTHQKIQYHARSETLAEKPAFRESFRTRRCVVPISSFYEWENKDSYKQPWNISIPDKSVMMVAAIWDEWKNPKNGKVKRGIAMVTVNPNETLATIHHRMPVVLTKEQMEIWLNPETTIEEALHSLQTYSGEMAVFPVTTELNSVRSEGKHLINKIDIPLPTISLFD